MKDIITILNEIRPGIMIQPSTNLIEDDVIDSFDLIYLVDKLEKHFGIHILPDEIIPENFNYPESIHGLVQRCICVKQIRADRSQA